MGASGRLRLSTIEKIAKALEVDEDNVFPEPSAKPLRIWSPSGLKWHVILTCPKCQARFRLLVEEGLPEPGQGEVSCPVCGFVQSISLRRAS